MNTQQVIKYLVYLLIAIIVVNAILPLVLLAACFIALKENEKGRFDGIADVVLDNLVTGNSMDLNKVLERLAELNEGEEQKQQA